MAARFPAFFLVATLPLLASGVIVAAVSEPNDTAATTSAQASWPPPTQTIRPDEIQAQKAKWEAAHVSSYQFDVTLQCFCPFYNKPFTMKAHDGLSAAITDSTGNAVALDSQGYQFIERFKTIDDVFVRLEDWNTSADSVRAEYDPEHGFPTLIVVDLFASAIDDESTTQIGNFRMLEPSELPPTGGHP